jgi:hypothetical protein
MAKYRYSLPPKKRFRCRIWRHRDTRVMRKIENMICAAKRLNAGGGWRADGSGDAWGSVGGRNTEWGFARTIKNGYWIGPWRREKCE